MVSLTEPQDRPPVLHLDDHRVPGRRTDTEGLHWSFDAVELEPSRRYTLALIDAVGRPLCDAWPLRTFPAPGDQPGRLRVLFYTCAGGHDLTGRFLSVATRARLLDRALSFQPDVPVANGDHVYWDQRRQVGAATAALPETITRITGIFDRSAPLLGTPAHPLDPPPPKGSKAAQASAENDPSSCEPVDQPRGIMHMANNGHAQSHEVGQADVVSCASKRR